jgi:hypothetical protein
MTTTSIVPTSPLVSAPWLADLPLAALHEARDLVACSIDTAAALDRLACDEDAVHLARELACLAAIAAEIIRRRPARIVADAHDCCSNVDGSHWDGCDCTCHAR